MNAGSIRKSVGSHKVQMVFAADVARDLVLFGAT